MRAQGYRSSLKKKVTTRNKMASKNNKKKIEASPNPTKNSKTIKVKTSTYPSNGQKKLAEEELQAANEKLQIVNTEMRSKLDEISRAYQESRSIFPTSKAIYRSGSAIKDRGSRLMRTSKQQGSQEN